MSETTLDDPRSVAVLIGNLDGTFNTDASEKLCDLVAKMRKDAEARGGSSKGKLTITLNLNMEGNAVDVLPTLKVEAPKARFKRTVMFATEGGNLQQSDPKQRDLPFAVVKDVGAQSPVRK